MPPRSVFNSLELSFERAWDGVWNLQGSYVLAYNKGNTEGYAKSDIGQDDAGISQDWDYPGLMEGAYGYLPNDRRHTLKLCGAYQVHPEWRIGANVRLQSGRPLNCLGWTRELGLQLAYEPEAWKGTTFQVDVMNVFNEREVSGVEEGGESAAGTPSPNYLRPFNARPAVPSASWRSRSSDRLSTRGKPGLP